MLIEETLGPPTPNAAGTWADEEQIVQETKVGAPWTQPSMKRTDLIPSARQCADRPSGASVLANEPSDLGAEIDGRQDRKVVTATCLGIVSRVAPATSRAWAGTQTGIELPARPCSTDRH